MVCPPIIASGIPDAEMFYVPAPERLGNDRRRIGP